METISNKKELLLNFTGWIMIGFAFLIAMAVPYLTLPLSDAIMSAVPGQGVLKAPFDILINMFVNGTLVFWIIKRSAYSGYKLFIQLFLIVFLVQTFQTQIETAYFISGFPLLKGNFETYMLILRGAMGALIFAGLSVLISLLIRSKAQLKTFDTSTDRIVRKALWLNAVYVILYMLFGYFVAWQSREVRLFYGGPEHLNSLFGQWRNSLIDMPELPFFQYCRGFLWIGCLVPFFRGFTGGRRELVILSALILGLIPTVQLFYPNPLMPSGVSVYHFVEVTVSNGIFGAITAWLIPVQIPAVLSGKQGSVS